jgi:hypothetical protein
VRGHGPARREEQHAEGGESGETKIHIFLTREVGACSKNIIRWISLTAAGGIPRIVNRKTLADDVDRLLAAATANRRAHAQPW